MKKHSTHKTILGGLLLVLGMSLAGAQTNAPVSLKQISRATGQARTVFTRFVQERHLSLFNEPLRSEGFLCFQKPGRIRWETTSPYKSILVSDGSGVAQFEWTDEKWRKLDLGLGDALQNVVSQIAGVMDGQYASDQRSYTATVTNVADEFVITLVPQNETVRKMMAAIEVHLAADLKGTRRVILRENGGDYTEIQFSEQFVNLELPAKTFDRSAPVDIEQIRVAAAAAKP
jgi:outer membrane lipoprotein-sorting protein